MKRLREYFGVVAIHRGLCATGSMGLVVLTALPAYGASRLDRSARGSTRPIIWGADTTAVRPANSVPDTSRTAVCDAQSRISEQALAAGDPARSVAALDVCLARWAPEIAAEAATPDSVLIANMDVPTMMSRVHAMLTQRARLRSALIGHPVPVAIEAPYWVNAPHGTTRADLSAPLTLIEFVAAGCSACEQFHPIVRRVAARYYERGVRVMVMSFVHGKTPTADSVTLAQELAYNQSYWSAQLGASTPVALVTYTPHDLVGLLPRPLLFKAFGANGVPTFYLVDGHGIVRDAIEVVPQEFEARLTAAVERGLRIQK